VPKKPVGCQDEGVQINSHNGIRLVLLTLLIFLINMWTVHHLGGKLWELSIANSFLLFVGIGEFVFKVVGNAEGKTVFQNSVRRLLFIFLRPTVLIGLYSIFFIAGSLVSSVTVLSSGYERKQVNVVLFSDGMPGTQGSAKTLEGPDGLVRFTKLTSPFGRPLFLKVDGFIRYSFDLLPWFGKKIRIAQDLQIEPTLLIRLPISVLNNLKDADLEIYVEGKPVKPPDLKNVKDEGSVLIGPDIPILSSFAEKWKLEILAGGTEDRTAIARILRAWQKPLMPDSDLELAPGSHIKIVLRRHGKILSQTEFVMSHERILDIALVMEEIAP
jgi:hypothetical protein